VRRRFKFTVFPHVLEFYPLRPVLIIEDSTEDFTALSRIFRKYALHHPILRCDDGTQALEYLQGYGKAVGWPPTLPALVLLDLYLPSTDGHEVLRIIKQDPQLRAIPVVAISGSASSLDIDYCYQQGVNSYLVKPVSYAALEDKIRLTIQYWLEASELPQEIWRANRVEATTGHEK
jgi:CheY-like chemotaxis protein